jgi:hypothetical protein
MSLTETKTIDKIEIVGNSTLQVREATIVMRDGAEIAKTYHRWTFEPGADVSAMPANVQAVAAAAWTPEVISAHQQARAEAAQRMGVQA